MLDTALWVFTTMFWLAFFEYRRNKNTQRVLAELRGGCKHLPGGVDAFLRDKYRKDTTLCANSVQCPVSTYCYRTPGMRDPSVYQSMAYFEPKKGKECAGFIDADECR